MKSAIIIGASSGIGRALAVTLSVEGYRVGVVARRTELLAELRAELAGP
jgi:short-subunit dehydrogenase